MSMTVQPFDKSFHIGRIEAIRIWNQRYGTGIPEANTAVQLLADGMQFTHYDDFYRAGLVEQSLKERLTQTTMYDAFLGVVRKAGPARANVKTSAELQAARRAAAARYAALGAQWVERIGVRDIVPAKSLTAHGYANGTKIRAPYPAMTRNRLFVTLTACGQIVHRPIKIRALHEYQAVCFAIDVFKENGIRVPTKMLVRAKSRVCNLVCAGRHRPGHRFIPISIKRWCGFCP